MRLLTQTLVLSWLGFASLGRRKWTALVLIGSVACVIGVLLSMLSVTAGMLRAYHSGEDRGLALVLSPETNADFGNNIPANAIGTILDAPGIAKGADGHPLGDPEVLIWVPPTGAFDNGSPSLRGVGAAGLALRPSLRVVAGRPFRAGRQEVNVGIAAARAFNLKVGDTIILPGGTWPIVGVFSDGGSTLEGEYLGDADTLMAAGHMSGFGSVLVRLKDPGAFADFEHWLATNPTLKVDAERQSHYAVRTVNRTSAFFTALTYVVCIIMALGAALGIVKLMYAAVSIRTREIATLRTIGYQPLPVALAVLLETTALSLAGALVGSGVAWLLCNGRHVVEMRNLFDLDVSARLFLLGFLWALALAVVGGLLPAIRAARLSVADAFRVI